jgi:MFS family permease
MQSFVMFLITYCLLGLGEAIIWPVLGAYASIEGRRRYGHGTMMGVFSLAMSGGIMTGAMLAGFSMDAWGIEFAYFVTAGTVFIGAVCAVIMIGTSAKKESELPQMEQTDLHGAESSLGTG